MSPLVLAATIALLLVAAPPESDPGVASGADAGAESDVLAPGELQLVPREAGRYELLDAAGEPASAPVQLDGAALTLELAPGLYFLHGPRSVTSIVIRAGQSSTWDGQELLPTSQWEAEQAAAEQARVAAERVTAERAAAEQAAAERAQAAADALDREQAALAAREQTEAAAEPTWQRWASPLGSLLIPGLGQFLNGQGGKGTGLLFASIGSVAAASALYTLPNDGTRPAGAEYARLLGYGLFSTTAPLLWVYGIADAYRVANDKEVVPLVDHQVRLSFTRMMTVGFRADPSRPGFYDDWSVSIMGQATKRVSVGISDLSIKTANRRAGPQVWQFGARVDYRVMQRKRVWLDLALGSVLQVASGYEALELDPDVAVPPRKLAFGATPYGQLDLRVFVLDRLSLDFIPRLAVPVTTRYYSASRALPPFAPTLELGAGVSAFF